MADEDLEQAVRDIQNDPLFMEAKDAEQVEREYHANPLWQAVERLAQEDEHEAIEGLLAVDLFDRKSLLEARMRVMLARAIPGYLRVLLEKAKTQQEAWNESEYPD